MIKRTELETYLNSLLLTEQYQDYGPNGLQIEGNEQIQKVVFAVSACAESIEKAVELKADALICHHGLFWKFHGPKTITKAFGKRVVPLIKNDINLFGYHLPLDGHNEVGNAAQIAKKIGLRKCKPFGDYKGMPTGVKGEFSKAIEAKQLKEDLEKILNHDIILSSPENKKTISSMGIITGGANNDWELAYQYGLDAFLTGEISEYNWHEARESGVFYFAGGHHATERFGVLALKEKVEKKFSLECHFVDSDNLA